jgi:membrane metallo-endopeptidase-like protein 1
MQLALPSRDYYLKKSSEAELKAYHNYMTSVAVLLGANPHSAMKEFDRVIILEKQLANVRFFSTFITISSNCLP